MAYNYDDDFEAYEDDFDDGDIDEPIKPVAIISSAISKSTNVTSTSKIPINDSKSIASSSKSLKPNILRAKELTVSEYKQSDNISQAQSKSKQYIPADEPIYNGKFSSSISLTDTLAINPYLRRLKTLHKSKVLDLQEEKFNQLNILPTTLADLYYRQLKGSSSTSTSSSAGSGSSTTESNNVTATTTSSSTTTTMIRQVGTNTREETRDVEMNTEEIIYYDKEMQFSYGSDDTLFLNILKDIQNKGKNNTKKHSKASNINDSDAYKKSNINSDDVSNYSGLSKLSTFLQKSSMLCEIILDDGRIKAEENNKYKQSKTVDNSLNTLDKSILDHSSPWIKFGENERNGSTELIAFRNVVDIKFSTLQPNLILTVHPYPTAENDISHELKPFKGLYCIWDTSSASAPVFVLEGTGQPTSCCFSCSQSFIVVAGTEEGTLLMWNLLESSSIHKDRDSKDLDISRGIRKPCYTTVLSNDSRLQLKEIDDEMRPLSNENEYHVAAITQVEPLGQNDGLKEKGAELQQPQQYSQFVSIDITGKVIFWITKSVNISSSVSNDSSDLDSSNSIIRKASASSTNVDLGLSPWSNLMLISVRSLRVNEFINDSSFLSNNVSNANMADDVGSGIKTKTSGSKTNKLDQSSSSSSILSSPCVLGMVPNDVSSVYASISYGRVCKCNRYSYGAKETNASSRNLQSNVLKPRNYNTSALSDDDVVNCLNLFGDQHMYSNVTSITVQTNLSSLHSKYDIKRSHNFGRKGGDSKQNDETKSSSYDENDSSSSTSKSQTSTTILGQSSFIIIGRDDGSIDLYAANEENNYLLHTWSTTSSSGDFGSNTNSQPSLTAAVSIVFLKWCPQKASSFFAINSVGMLYYFDILVDPFAPLLTEQLPCTLDKERDTYGKCLFDIGISKYSNSNVYLAIKLKNKYGMNTIQVHKLSDTNIKLCKTMTVLLEEDVALRSSLSVWACRMHIVISSAPVSVTNTSSSIRK